MRVIFLHGPLDGLVRDVAELTTYITIPVMIGVIPCDWTEGSPLPEKFSEETYQRQIFMGHLSVDDFGLVQYQHVRSGHGSQGGITHDDSGDQDGA